MFFSSINRHRNYFKKIIILPVYKKFLLKENRIHVSEMNVNNFYNIIDSVNKYQVINRVILGGNDPILWGYLTEAIEYLYKNNYFTSIITYGNKIFLEEIINDKIDIYYNIKNCIINNNIELIKENIDKYFFFDKKKQNRSIRLTYDFSVDEKYEDIIKAFDISWEYNIHIIFNPELDEISKYNNSEILKSNIHRISIMYDFIREYAQKKGENKNIKVKKKKFYFDYKNIVPSYTIIPCIVKMFEDSICVYTCNKCKLFKPTFHWDGKTVTFCPNNTKCFNLRDYNDISKLKEDLLDTIKSILLKSKETL